MRRLSGVALAVALVSGGGSGTHVRIYTPPAIRSAGDTVLFTNAVACEVLA